MDYYLSYGSYITIPSPPGDGHRPGNLPGLRCRRHLCAHGAGGECRNVGAAREEKQRLGLGVFTGNMVI